jgi:hypothetical protein
VFQQSISRVQGSTAQTSKLLVFDFFSGTGSSTQAFEDAGHTVIRVELDDYFDAHERDILALTADGLIAKYGQPDFIWASPPCTAFSVASIGHHWNMDKTPKTEQAKFNQTLVAHTIKLIKGLQPRKGWLMENPRGMLRTLPVVDGLIRRTITYCQYGDTRMKPTDLWGELDWTPRDACKNGMSCHEAAPRGSRTGTQGLKGAKDRSRVPYDLSKDICDAVHSPHNETLYQPMLGDA